MQYLKMIMSVLQKLYHVYVKQKVEKMKNERLRDYAENDVDASDAFYKKIADSLANEIERYYIHRPRYEDGKLVQFLDRLENGKLVVNITYHHAVCIKYWSESNSNNSLS